MKLGSALIIGLLILSSVPFISAANVHSSNIHASSIARWTFMVYMDADNTLSDYAPDDLAEMMTYGSNSNVSIVVLYDSTQSGDSGIYLIEKGKKKLLESLGEVDMGSEATLYNFINWTYHNYPAEHYFLDLWDHGANYEGVCLDHGDWLTLNELDSALSNFMLETGKKIDVVGFDACRMGSIEVYYALKDYTNYVVASEKDEPADGWPYYDILSKLSDKNPEEASELVVDAMYNWAKRFYKDDGLSVILASVNMSRLQGFIGEFNANLQSAMSVASYLNEEIINSTRDVERYELSTVADFYNLMEKMDEVGDYKLSKLAKATMEGIENITYFKAWDCPNPANGVHAKNAHGIGVYYPQFAVSGDYYSTEFAKDTYWDDFLKLVFNPPGWKGHGEAELTVNGGNVSVIYSTNGSYVDIYISNSSIYSGILPSTGNFTASVGYGTYTIYLYSYDSHGNVRWLWKESIEHTRKVKIIGKFYLNGNIAKGAKITVEIGNRSFTTSQNESGFSLSLYYPQDIRDNSTIIIKVQYGLFEKEYTYKISSLKGDDVLPLVIKDNTFPSVFSLLISSVLLTIFAVLLVFLLRRFGGE